MSQTETIEKIQIGVPCTPATSTSLIPIGMRKKVVFNMGSGYDTVIGELISQDNKRLNIILSESNRPMVIYHSYISCIEDVMLYRQVHHHKNGNFPTPMINYYITMGKVQIVQSKTYQGDLKHPMVKAIVKEKC